jgi:hypothetical protein
MFDVERYFREPLLKMGFQETNDAPDYFQGNVIVGFGWTVVEIIYKGITVFKTQIHVEPSQEVINDILGKVDHYLRMDAQNE